MIKTRLLQQVPSSMKYIIMNVIFQWIKLGANIFMMFVLAGMLETLLAGPVTLGQFVPQIVELVCILAIRYACTYLTSRSSLWASSEVKLVLRKQMYEKMTRLGASYNERVTTSEVIQVFVEGVDQLEQYFGKFMPQFFYAFLAPLTLFVVYCTISWKVAIVLLILVPMLPGAIMMVQTIAKKRLSKYWGIYTDMGGMFLENMQGLTTLKTYQADERKNVEMNEKAEEFRKITMKVLTMQLNSIIIMDTVAYGGAALGIVIAMVQCAHGTVTLPEAFMMIMLAADYFLPMRMLGSYFHVAMNGMTAADKLFALIDLPEEEDGTAVLDDYNQDFSLQNVNFSYDGEKQILKDVSLTIPAGNLVALVGESGCGKSTIASLLCSTTKGYEGSIKIGDTEVRDIQENNLLANVTAVNFNSYLFTGTIEDTLRMAAPKATEDQLIQALKDVNLWDFLSTQKGLQTELKQEGSNLSGGQRQRLALARALLHDTPIYIFDEITSNIDAESEEDIMNIIRGMAGKRTVLLISHRLGNVVKANNIYVLDAGKVVESGTHESLMNQKGKYCEMYSVQADLEQYATKGGETA